MCKVCHFNFDSLVFAAGCFLTVSDRPVNRQKAANDFFFLVNGCLMYSASWNHSASSDVAQLTTCMSKGLAAIGNPTLTKVCHLSMSFNVVVSLKLEFSSKNETVENLAVLILSCIMKQPLEKKE